MSPAESLLVKEAAAAAAARIGEVDSEEVDSEVDDKPSTATAVFGVTAAEWGVPALDAGDDGSNTDGACDPSSEKGEGPEESEAGLAAG